MQSFIAGILVKVLTNPVVQAKIKELLGQLIVERILPLIPVVTAAAAKAAVDQVIAKIPGIEGVVDVVKVAEDTRVTLNELIPDIDIGVPVLDDLIDFWRPKPDHQKKG